MRLQKSKVLKVREKEYYRWSVVLSPEIVGRLGWGKGDILNAQVKGDKVVISRLAKAP